MHEGVKLESNESTIRENHDEKINMSLQFCSPSGIYAGEDFTVYIKVENKSSESLYIRNCGVLPSTEFEFTSYHFEQLEISEGTTPDLPWKLSPGESVTCTLTGKTKKSYFFRPDKYNLLMYVDYCDSQEECCQETKLVEGISVLTSIKTLIVGAAIGGLLGGLSNLIIKALEDLKVILGNVSVIRENVSAIQENTNALQGNVSALLANTNATLAEKSIILENTSAILTNVNATLADTSANLTKTSVILNQTYDFWSNFHDFVNNFLVIILSVILSVFAVITLSRKTGAQQLITIQDIWGGAFIGFLVGIFGYAYFKNLVGIA